MPTVIMTSDEARLLRGLRRVVAESKTVEGGFKGAERAGVDAGNRSGSAFGAMLPRLTAATAAAAALAAAYKLASAELRNMIDLQAKAAGAQISAETSSKNLIRNLSGKDEATIRAVQEAAKNISAQTGVSESIINQSMAQGLSASGQNVPLTIQSVGLASRLLADDPSAIARQSGAIIDVSKVTGESDAMTNLGFLQRVMSLSRVVDPDAAAKAIPRATIGMRSLGADADDAAALFATLSTGAADVSGEPSGTAAIRFSEQLRDFFEKNKIDITDDSEQIQHLQQNKKLAQRFLKDLSLESQFKGLGEQLVSDPASEVSRSYFSNLQAIGGAESWRATGQSALKNMELAPEHEVGSLKRFMRNATEQLLLDNPGAGVIGVLRDEVGPLLQGLGKTRLKQQIEEIGLNLESGTGNGRKALQDAYDLIVEETPQTSVIVPGPTYRGFPSTAPRELAPYEERQLVILDKVADRLSNLIIEMDRNTKSTTENSKSGQRGPSNVTLGRPGEDR